MKGKIRGRRKAPLRYSFSFKAPKDFSLKEWRQINNPNYTKLLTLPNEKFQTFYCDDDFYVITSFNPLSFDGDYSKENQRGEIGELSRDKSNLLSYRSFFF